MLGIKRKSSAEQHMFSITELSLQPKGIGSYLKYFPARCGTQSRSPLLGGSKLRLGDRGPISPPHSEDRKKAFRGRGSTHRLRNCWLSRPWWRGEASLGQPGLVTQRNPVLKKNQKQNCGFITFCFVYLYLARLGSNRKPQAQLSFGCPVR